MQGPNQGYNQVPQNQTQNSPQFQPGQIQPLNNIRPPSNLNNNQPNMGMGMGMMNLPQQQRPPQQQQQQRMMGGGVQNQLNFDFNRIS